jgi:hypothetical protein
MVDYIGPVGCGFFMLILDVFSRFFHLFQPIAIASLRYIFVVKNHWIKSHGIRTTVNAIIVFFNLLPLVSML